MNEVLNVSIAKVSFTITKEKAGIHERENYNVGSGKGVVPNCPKEKEDAIMDAFRHFNMI